MSNLQENNYTKPKAYIIGCSHASGSELEGDGIGHLTPFNLDNSFASRLAKKMNYEPINLALPGASNDYIFRKLVELTPEIRDIIILCWTGLDRIEIFDDVLDEWLNFSHGMSLDHDPKFTKTHRNFYDLYVKLMCDENLKRGTLNKIKNIVAAHTWADKILQRTVIHIDTSWKIIDHPEFKNLIELIKDSWILPETTFTDWAKSKNYRYSPVHHHYGVDAHEDFAQLCFDYIEQKLPHIYYRPPKRNSWATFLKLNQDLIPDELKPFIDKFYWAAQYVEPEWSNYFVFDGWAGKIQFKLLEALKNSPNLSLPIIDPYGYTMFSSLAEAFCSEEIFQVIHHLMEMFKLDPDRCVYHTAAWNAQELYDKFCLKNEIKKPLKACTYSDSWRDPNNKFYKYPFDTQSEDMKKQYVTADNKKLFCSFNFNQWDHRVLSIIFMNYYDLLDEGYVSAPTVLKHVYDVEKDISFYDDRIWLYYRDSPLYLDLKESLSRLKDRWPLKLDDLSKVDNIYSAIFDKQIYIYRENSLFEFINETATEPGEIFYTEKVFRAIQQSKPFILLSTAPGMLQGLREMGFRTFSPYIDESYDIEPVLQLRIEKAVKSLCLLSELRKTNPLKFYKNYHKICEILEYNKKKFLNYELNNSFKQAFLGFPRT